MADTPSDFLSEIRDLLAAMPDKLAGATAAVMPRSQGVANKLWQTTGPAEGIEEEDVPAKLQSIERGMMSIFSEWNKGFNAVMRAVGPLSLPSSPKIEPMQGDWRTPPPQRGPAAEVYGPPRELMGPETYHMWPAPENPKEPPRPAPDIFQTVASSYEEPNWRAAANMVAKDRPTLSKGAAEEYERNANRRIDEALAAMAPENQFKPARPIQGDVPSFSQMFPGRKAGDEAGLWSRESSPSQVTPPSGSMFPQGEAGGVARQESQAHMLAELRKISGALTQPQASEHLSPLEGVAAEFDAMEGFPAASPSVSVSNQGGFKGAGGKPLGSIISPARRRNLFLEPGGKTP